MKEPESIYNIVYAANDSFTSIMGISIDSLLKNNKNASKINITILNTDISDSNIAKLSHVVGKYENVSLRWVRAVDIEKKLKINVSQDRGSVSQYARLFLNNLFDKSVDKLLYLDCDTLIDGSIYNLWNINLRGKTIGALKDAFSKYYRKNIELANDDIMFNSGVMLVDLRKWRAKHVEERLQEFIIRHNGNIQQGDQGALNAVLSKEVYALSPKYNFLSIFTDYTYRQIQIYRHPINFYSRKEIEEASKNPVIIHFTSSIFTNRPWEKGCRSKYLDKWLKYKEGTPWKSLPLREDKRGLVKKSIRVVYNLLPLNVALFIASIFQAYIRPIKNSIRGM